MEEWHSEPCLQPDASNRKTSKTKLKFSCDACAKSKLKCGKQRPVCQRCLLQSLQCVYSPARRLGKPRALKSLPTPERNYPAKTSTGNSSPSEHLRLPEKMQSRPIEVEIARSWDEGSLILENDLWGDLVQPHELASSTEMTIGVESTTNDPHNILGPCQQIIPFWTDALEDDSRHDHDFDPQSSLGVNSLTMDFSPGQDFSASMNANGYGNLASHIWTNQDLEIPEKSSLSFSQLQKENNEAPARHSCSARALCILQNLPTTASPCGTRGPSLASGTTNIDGLLQVAKQATEQTMIIFECGCSFDPQLILLLTLISSKILSSYEDIVQQVTNIFPPACASSKSNDIRVPRFSLEISIGSFKLDPTDEHRMIIQVIFIQLGKVRQLQKFFTKRISEPTQDIEKEQMSLVCSKYLESRLKVIVELLLNTLHHPR